MHGKLKKLISAAMICMVLISNVLGSFSYADSINKEFQILNNRGFVVSEEDLVY